MRRAVYGRETPWHLTAVELREQLALKRRSVDFLAFQEGDGIGFFVLDPEIGSVSIGRDDECDIGS